MTNSTLHNLAVPHIYARFDIVWPDGHVASTDSKSVDALTYGLSTLCLGSSFARTTRRLFCPDAPRLSRFKGNEYAKYTRKFSLGNGPADWVAEYMICKESGKMLGTLVALAVAKMVSLETFVWDMPTGVLSDIFMALASLPEQHPNNECKLDRVWIRWHDNSESAATPAPPNNGLGSALISASVPGGSTLTPVGILLPDSASHPPPRGPVSYAEHPVEYPTFSVLPPLKSLSVLEIDELAYLDEMAGLIARSVDRLMELRVGISAKAIHKDFAQTWDGSSLQQIDHAARWPGESTIGERRLGGVLGVLVGKILRRRILTKEKVLGAVSSALGTTTTTLSNTPLPAQVQAADDEAAPTGSSTPASVDAPQNGIGIQPAPGCHAADLRGACGQKLNLTKSDPSGKNGSTGRKRLDGKLRLQTLELERVALSLHVCRYAIDWTTLTSVTILDCAQHEALWKMLKRQYQPMPAGSGWGVSTTTKPAGSNTPLQYQLQLKRIHTDAVSAALISFIKETLAPNSLEVLFLQDRKRNPAIPLLVTIDQIFKGAVKRHRSSLRKLLIDSSQRPSVQGVGTMENTTSRWQKWVLSSEMVQYITSGRMGNLRELAVSLDYKDWVGDNSVTPLRTRWLTAPLQHSFLQRLPNLPQLRSLNIPNIDNYISERLEPRELAMQIADIITLRPEIQLCYVGISTKCFEILETRNDQSASNGSTGGNEGGTSGTSVHGSGATDATADNAQGGGTAEMDTSEEEDDDEEGDEEDDDDDDGEDTEDDDDGDDGTPTGVTDPDETQSENEGGDESDDDSFVEDPALKTRLRLREILFYDDKVAIFKARHGKL